MQRFRSLDSFRARASSMTRGLVELMASGTHKREGQGGEPRWLSFLPQLQVAGQLEACTLPGTKPGVLKHSLPPKQSPHTLGQAPSLEAATENLPLRWRRPARSLESGEGE